MKAIILCAGQGRRLLPYTKSTPKCLIQLGDKSFIEWQIDALHALGIMEIIAVVGYAAERVDQQLQRQYGNNVTTVYNPFYEIADNLASCWIAREHLQGEFILMNGDTLFEPAIAAELLSQKNHPIVLVTDRKSSYDDDDMKIIEQDSQLQRVGKKLALESVNGESIGMMHFTAQGADLFRNTLEQMMYTPEALQKWYLTIIDELAQQGYVGTCCIHGKQWTELDFVHDLEVAKKLVSEWQSSKKAASQPG